MRVNKTGSATSPSGYSRWSRLNIARHLSHNENCGCNSNQVQVRHALNSVTSSTHEATSANPQGLTASRPNRPARRAHAFPRRACAPTMLDFGGNSRTNSSWLRISSSRSSTSWRHVTRMARRSLCPTRVSVPGFKPSRATEYKPPTCWTGYRITARSSKSKAKATASKPNAKTESWETRPEKGDRPGPNSPPQAGWVPFQPAN